MYTSDDHFNCPSSLLPVRTHPSGCFMCVIRFVHVHVCVCAYVCIYVYVRACVPMYACVYTRACVHTTCVYSVPVRPATRSPSTTNTARTIVVSATAGYTGCLVQLGTSSNRAVAYVCVCLKRAKWKRRGGDAVKKNSLTLVLESIHSFFPLTPFWAVEV